MEEQKKIKFSFIIPVSSELHHIRNLLDSIAIQDFDPEEFEFILIDTRRDGKLKTLAEEFKKLHPAYQIKIIQKPSASLLEARNAGIGQAQGEILIFVEDDVIFEKDYFKNLVENISQISGAFAGGGKIIPVFEQQKPPWLIKFFMPLLAEVNLKEKHKVFPKKLYPYGINMLVHRKIFEKTGLFDPTPETNHGPEHTTLSEKKFIDRVRQAGFPVYYFGNLLVWNYIPDEQLNRKYIRKQAEIALQMELENAKEKGKIKFWRFILKELLKYIATIGIGFYYLITTQWEKLKSIFQYRYWSFKIILQRLLNKK